MNKKVIGVAVAVLALGAAYAGASWWLGQRVEARYQALLDRAVAQWGADKIAERRYERGLFSARSTVVLQFRLPALPTEAAADATPAPQALRVTLQDDIRHGPLPGLRLAAARIRTRVTQVEGLDEATRQVFAKASAPEFDTLAGFDGGYSGRMLLPAGELADPRVPGNRAEWQALTYDYTLAADARHTTGTLLWPQASFEAQQPRAEEDDAQPSAQVPSPAALRMRMDALRFSFDMTQAEDQWLLAPGKGSGSVGALEVTERAAGQADFRPLLQLRDTRLETETTQDGALLDMVYRAFGPGRIGSLDMKELRYESQLRRVDARALATAQKLLMQIVSAPQGAEVAPPPEALDTMAQQLLAGRPEYRDSFSATSADGQTAQFGYGLAVDELPADRAAAMEGMPWQLTLTQRVRFDAALRLPKAWIPTLAQLINDPDTDANALAETAGEFARQGWLREDGDAYVAKAEFGAGRLLLNGQPFMGGLGRAR